MIRLGVGVGAAVAVIAVIVGFGRCDHSDSRTDAFEAHAPVVPRPQPSQPPHNTAHSLERQRANALRDRIREANRARADRPPAAAANSDQPRGSASEATRAAETRFMLGIEDVLKPLINECYRSALQNDPTLQGEIRVEFVLIGEPGIGAVIEASKIADDSTVNNTELRECISESAYALDSAPASMNGTTVNIPFVLIPERGAVTPKELGRRNSVNGVPI